MSKKETIEVVVLEHDVILGSRYVVKEVEVEESEVKNEDGTITFFMEFYNGGTCLSEMIEKGLERLNKDK